MGALHDALIAHGELNTRNIVVVDGRPVIADFTKATTGADERRRAADLAELLTSTALLVGDDRAIAALSAGLGADALGDVIPMLQAPALTRTTQAMLGKHREAGKRLGELRTAAAKAAGVDVPELVELHRVSPTNLMMAIGTLVAAAVLLGQVGSPQEIWDTVKNAEWWLLGVALALSLATNIPYAIALMGCVPEPPSAVANHRDPAGHVVREPRDPRSRRDRHPDPLPAKAWPRPRVGGRRGWAAEHRRQRRLPDPAVRHRGRALAHDRRHRTDRHRVSRSRSCSSRSS